MVHIIRVYTIVKIEYLLTPIPKQIIRGVVNQKYCGPSETLYFLIYHAPNYLFGDQGATNQKYCGPSETLYFANLQRLEICITLSYLETCTNRKLTLYLTCKIIHMCNNYKM